MTNLGVPFVEDFNDPSQPASSITKLRTTVTEEGKRCSSNAAFLPEVFVKHRTNLKICFGAIVQRLYINSTEGIQRVAGVFVEGEKSKGTTYYVKGKETILCGGAVASPQLLLLR